MTLNTAPPNLPVWVLAFLDFFLCLASVDSVACWVPPAVISVSVPCSALMIVPLGIWRSSVSGTNTPCSLISTSPVAETLKLLPAIGGPGTPSLSVLNTTSGPKVVPSPFLATSRTW